MKASHVTFAAVILASICAVTIADRCPCPDEPEGGITLVSDTQLEDDYKKGSIVVWECKKGKGFGNVWIKCKDNGEWTKPSKKCKEHIEWNWGSLAGIVCAAFTIIVQVVFLLLATKMLKNKEEDEDMELRIMEAAKATENDKK